MTTTLRLVQLVRHQVALPLLTGDARAVSTGTARALPPNGSCARDATAGACTARAVQVAGARACARRRWWPEAEVHLRS